MKVVATVNAAPVIVPAAETRTPYPLLPPRPSDPEPKDPKAPVHALRVTIDLVKPEGNPSMMENVWGLIKIYLKDDTGQYTGVTSISRPHVRLQETSEGKDIAPTTDVGVTLLYAGLHRTFTMTFAAAEFYGGKSQAGYDMWDNSKPIPLKAGHHYQVCVELVIRPQRIPGFVQRGVQYPTPHRLMRSAVFSITP